MPVCYRKVGGKYYSPSEYKKLKLKLKASVSLKRGYSTCPRCCRSRCKGESFCEDCGYNYSYGRN